MSLKDIRNKIGNYLFGNSFFLGDTQIWAPKLSEIAKAIPDKTGFEKVDIKPRPAGIKLVGYIEERPLNGFHVLLINTEYGKEDTIEPVTTIEKDKIIKDFKEKGSFEIEDHFRGCRKIYTPQSVSFFKSDVEYLKNVRCEKME